MLPAESADKCSHNQPRKKCPHCNKEEKDFPWLLPQKHPDVAHIYSSLPEYGHEESILLLDTGETVPVIPQFP